MIKRKLFILLTAFFLQGFVSTAQALDFTWEDFNFNVSGIMGGYYTYTDCDVPVGASRWNTFSPCEFAVDGEDVASVQNGYLPTWINFKVSRTFSDDTTALAHFGFAPGTSGFNTFAGQRIAGAQNVGDVRNLYLSLSNDRWGSLKVGRDAGIFGLHGTLSDIAVPGIGTQAEAAGALNTTFGSVGAGYIYMSFMPQITYTTPVWNGFQAAFGVVQPLDVGPDPVTFAGPIYNTHDTPMIQGKLTYDFNTGSGVSGKLWGSFVNQEATQGSSQAQTGREITAEGYEIGGNLNVGGFTANLSGFFGDALGDSILFVGATDANGNGVETEGYLGNIAYTFNGKTKVAAQYGFTESDVVAGAEATAVIVGVYHTIYEGVSLVAEYIDHTTSQDGAPDAEAETYGLGLIWFF